MVLSDPNIYVKGHESILVGRCEGVAFRYGICEKCVRCVWNVCDEMIGVMKAEMKKDKGEGGGAKNKRNLKFQVQGHLYQNEPRANNFRSQNIRT